MMARYFPETSQSIATTLPPTDTSSSFKMYVTLLRSMRGTAIFMSSETFVFFVSKMCSFSGRENTIAGSSVEVKISDKLGPKQAAATRPFGTVHFSAFHDVAVSVFQTLNKIISTLL